MATLAQLFAQGYEIGESIPRRARARAAARERFGAAADDPDLFQQLEGMQYAANRDRRADASLDIQRSQNTRSQQKHNFTMGQAKRNQQRESTLRLVNGLRQARDRGDDVGQAFDNLIKTLPELGVDPGDLPEMRSRLLENPAVLDDYYNALQDGTRLTATAARDAQKRADEEAQRQRGAEGVTEVVTNLRELYQGLDEGKGITNPDKDAVSNMLRWIRSSWAGRTGGGIVGSENESYRRSIEAIRPHLINAIKSMEGLGAKMFDSNKDMEMWLATVSDPSADFATVIRALDQFESRYGQLKDELQSPDTQQNEAVKKNQVWIGMVVNGMRFKGGNPGEKDNWEPVN